MMKQECVFCEKTKRNYNFCLEITPNNTETHDSCSEIDAL